MDQVSALTTADLIEERAFAFFASDFSDFSRGGMTNSPV